MILEDMIMKGADSLACVCESDSEFYNPLRCNPDTYRATVNVSQDSLLYEPRDYTVSVPLDYTWDDGICTSLRFDPNYRPAFVSSQNLAYIRQGMRLAVTNGTATTANLPYIDVAGKTGTAEYCDDVARPLGLCKPGNWPAHAWFTAYAPYENPEILILGFIYNGGEGSANALPMVMETMEAYLRLKEQRASGSQPAPISVEPTTP
ncbi:MAG: penicillin-binding transpeptidase domain-containing protein [Anaerolineae bacterium]